MCRILSTTHLCSHKTLKPLDACPHFLASFARHRWASQLHCPYKQFEFKSDGVVCPGCTTEFGHPYERRGGSDGSGELERVKSPVGGTVKRALGWVARLFSRIISIPFIF